MNVPIIPGPDGPFGASGGVLISEIEEYLSEMARHRKDVPTTGSYQTSPGHGPKPKRSEIAQRSSNGAILWRVTAKLWGLGHKPGGQGSSKGGKKK